MDARQYFELTDAIAAASSADTLEELRDTVCHTEMHAFERRVLERVLRSRADALRLGDTVVPRPPVERGD